MDGILIINKPKEYTSHDVVAKVKKMFNVKVGHTGTLDPMATGVLPLLLGKGTKLSEYLVNHDKAYNAVLKLGIKTDTLDSEGNIIEKQEVDTKSLQLQTIEDTLKSMIGKQKQVPPMYSAIKVDGKKLYEYARSGKQVEVPPREIEIYDIKLLEINKQEQTIAFTVYCSKGTYIRSICEEIAKRLNTIGYMKELNRTRVGTFSIEQAITIEQLEENKQIVKEHIIDIPTFFKDYPCIYLNEEQIQLLINGVKLHTNNKDGIYQIQTENKDFIGIGIIKDKMLKRKLIIN